MEPATSQEEELVTEMCQEEKSNPVAQPSSYDPQENGGHGAGGGQGQRDPGLQALDAAHGACWHDQQLVLQQDKQQAPTQQHAKQQKGNLQQLERLEA